MKITGISVTDLGDARKVTITAVLASNEELAADDVAKIESVLLETQGALTAEEDPEPAKPKRRAAKEEEPEDEKPEEKPVRRRRSTKEEDDDGDGDGDDEETTEKPVRRRRSTKDEPKDEEPEEKPTRRRRSKDTEDDGPSAEDVAKACSMGSEELGTKYMKKVILEFSDDGTIAGIPADKRQAFIDEINNEIEAGEE